MVTGPHGTASSDPLATGADDAVGGADGRVDVPDGVGPAVTSGASPGAADGTPLTVALHPVASATTSAAAATLPPRAIPRPPVSRSAPRSWDSTPRPVRRRATRTAVPSPAGSPTHRRWR